MAVWLIMLSTAPIEKIHRYCKTKTFLKIKTTYSITVFLTPKPDDEKFIDKFLILILSTFEFLSLAVTADVNNLKKIVLTFFPNLKSDSKKLGQH